MLYREILLPQLLEKIAICAWEFRLQPGDRELVQHSIPPDGTTNLVLTRPPNGLVSVRLVGPSLSAVTVPVMRGFRYAGLRLRPEAARAVTGRFPIVGSTANCASQGELKPVWDDLVGMLDGDDAWIATIQMAEGVAPSDAKVANAVDYLIASGGRSRIAAISAVSDLSERQLRRRFQAATGLSPKQFANIQRTRRALILSLDRSDWAGIACDAGFADQSHLARDIKQRLGGTSRSVTGYLSGIQHELLAPVRVRKLQDAAAEPA